MEIAPLGRPAAAAVGTLGALGTMGTVAWYTMSVTVITSVVQSVPEVVETIQMGVEDVVAEAVHGSKLVVRCVSIGVVILAALVVVRFGYWVLAVLRSWMLSRSPLAKQRNPSDFRLKGGGKQGLSVKELFGSKAKKTEPDEAVDPSRLKEGDRFSFEYFRGSRAGQMRTCSLIQHKPNGVMECFDEDVHEIRSYWPSHTGKAIYHNKGEANPTPASSGAEQSGGSVTTAALPSSGVRARGKAALQEGGLGALQTWKESAGLMIKQAEDRALTKSQSERTFLKSSLPIGDAEPTDTEAEDRVTQTWFYTGAEMLPVFKQDFEGMQRSFKGTQYLIDHTECCWILSRQADNGIAGQLVLDKDNFFKSTCARQCARLQEMWKSGVQLRFYKPRTSSGFACQHSKSWIVDERVLLDGSCNLTHGGLDHNEEHLIRTVDKNAVAKALQAFESLWQKATVAQQSDMDIMQRNSDKKHEQSKSQGKFQRGTSSRSLSRSLSTELEEEPADKGDGKGEKGE